MTTVPLRTLGVALLASILGAQAPDLQAPPDAQNAPVLGARPGTQRFLVQFENRSFTLDAFRTARVARRPAAEVDAIVADMERRVVSDQAGFVEAIEQIGGSVVAQWWLVNGAAIEIEPGKVGLVRALPNVTRVDADGWAQPVIRTATNSANHNSDAVNANGQVGLGVTTACMDTGQDENMNGLGRPHRTYFVNGDINNMTGGGIGGSRLVLNRQIGSQPPDDVHGHGTGVASIQAGANWGTAGADNGHAPRAQIAGYSISDNTGGGANFTTITAAWQAIAADAAQYSIVSANNSYSGSSSPTHVSQQALDSCAFNADVLICCAAGNGGSSTSSSQSVANGLAVAAVNPTAHTMATFSSRGPLSGDTGRFYPDISACGVSTVMARRNNEGSDYVASGTSMASPMVTGAATLVRNANRAMTADTTKAVLLASTRDISAQNPNAPYNSRNAYGMGLLRDDDAVTIATDPDRHGRWCVDRGNTSCSRRMAVVSGQLYQVAIAWHRQVFTTNQWANLDLAIYNGATLVAQSNTTRNLYEMVRFRPNFSGTVEIRVTVAAFESGRTDQWFGWAANVDTSSARPGSYTIYGTACRGTAGVPLITGTTPAIDSSVTVSLGQVPANTAAVLFFGVSDSIWLRLRLPFDMTPLGAQCSLLASGEVQIGTSTGRGSVALRFGIPKRFELVGARLYNQWLVIDRGANALGLISSAGGALLIGEP